MGLDFSKALLPVSTVLQISADEARPVLRSGEAPGWGLRVRVTLWRKSTCNRGLRLRACGKLPENSIAVKWGPWRKEPDPARKVAYKRGKEMLLVSSEPWPRGNKRHLLPQILTTKGVSISPASSFCSGCERGAHPACIHACHSGRVGGVETDNEEQRMMAIISWGQDCRMRFLIVFCLELSRWLMNE